MDYHKLTGLQRKILRESLQGVFGRKSLDMFLGENDFGSLEDLVDDAPFANQVYQLIGDLIARGKLNQLMRSVEREYAGSPYIVDLDQRLALAAKEIEEQRTVIQKGLERMVREAGFADPFLWSEQLLAHVRRVCRISYPAAGGLVRGTGFLVCPDLVLTNYHVAELLINGKADPDQVRVQFGYAETNDGLQTGQKFRLAAQWNVASAPYSQADLAPNAGLPSGHELDYALLRLDGEPKRGNVSIGAGGQAKEGGIVFVLQHVEGKPVKQSIGVVVKEETPLRLRYDADTDHGSSGGLVLNHALEPVALHHAGDPDAKIKAKFNQGIPLALIRAAIDATPGLQKCW
jgi:hypothetical protein